MLFLRKGIQGRVRVSRVRVYPLKEDMAPKIAPPCKDMKDMGPGTRDTLPHVNRHMLVKTLLSRNFIGDRQQTHDGVVVVVIIILYENDP